MSVDPWDVVIALATGLMAGIPTIYFVSRAGVRDGLERFSRSIEGAKAELRGDIERVRGDLADHKARAETMFVDARRMGAAAWNDVRKMQDTTIPSMEARIRALEEDPP